MNKAILLGNLTRDPETIFSQNGVCISKFSIAINEKRKKGDEYIENTTFLDIVTFGKLAEICDKYIAKGQQVLIEGKIEIQSYEDKNGIKRKSTQIIANEVKFVGGKPKKTEEPEYKQVFGEETEEDDTF